MSAEAKLPAGLAMFSLHGRTILVTGAGRGLGRAMARATAAAGAEVVGVSRSEEELAETAGEIGAFGGIFHPLARDLRGGEAAVLVGEAVERGGGLDGVVHAAGTQLRKSAFDVTRGEWRLVQELNVEVAFFLSVAVAAYQRAAGIAGSHVFVGSLASSLGFARIAPYVASKSAVLGTVRSLAVELAPDAIRVNAVVPGYFRTALTAEVLDREEDRARIVARIPLGRIGEPDELAGAVVYLLSEAGRYTTGQGIAVDGGWLAG